MAAESCGDGESCDEEQDEDSRNEVGEKTTTEGLAVDLLKGISEVHTRLQAEEKRREGRGGEAGEGVP